VSEVQVYYKDDGLIAAKVDILLEAKLTIQQAHSIAVTARKAIEKTLPGIGDIDVDLELEESSASIV
jgi:divalent metal cation (Fe/Co/Zn/Cd) transporter